MKFPSDKRKKHLFSFFITLIVTYSFFGITAFASRTFYNNIPYNIAKHFVVRNIPTQWLRSIGFSILCFLGQVVDFMYNAVETISKLNLYTLIQDTFDFEGLFYPIAWTVLSLSLVIGAIFMMTHYEKFQMSEFLRNIITSIVLIVTLPALFSALSDFRNEGLEVVDKIDVSSNSSSSVPHSLGEQIIASNVIDVEFSAEKKKIIRYTDLNLYSNTDDYLSIYDLDINYWLPNDSGDFKYKYISKIPSSYDFIDVTEFYDETSERAELLGFKTQYTIANLWDNSSKKQSVQCTNFNEYTIVGYSPSGAKIYLSYELTRNEFEDKVLELIASHPSISGNKELSEYIRSISTVETYGVRKINYALDNIPDDIYRKLALPLTQQYNEDLSLDNESYAGQYQLERLIDADDLEDMDMVERLKYIFLYDEGEAIYVYDFSFLETFLVLIVTIICLVFAGIKVASLLYDVVFAQIIAPVVIGTSLQSSERTKKIMQEIFSCFLLFVIVILVFKIYLIVILWVMQQDFNFVVKCFLFIGGAKFVIDGPDLVTKLIGLDAGVKSGYGALMGTQAALRTVSSATKSAYNTVGNARNILTGNSRTGSTGVVGAIGSVAGGIANAPRNIAERTGQLVGGVEGRLDNIRNHLNGNVQNGIGNAFDTSPNVTNRDNTAPQNDNGIINNPVQPTMQTNTFGSNNVDRVSPNISSPEALTSPVNNNLETGGNSDISATSSARPRNTGAGAFISSAFATSSVGNAFRQARATTRADSNKRQNDIENTINIANEQVISNRNVSRDTSDTQPPRTYAEMQMENERLFNPQDFD